MLTEPEEQDTWGDQARIEAAQQVLAGADDVLFRLEVCWLDGRRAVRVRLTDDLEKYRRRLMAGLGSDGVVIEKARFTARQLHVFYALGRNGEQAAGCTVCEHDDSVIVALTILDWRGAKTLRGGFTPSHATVELKVAVEDRPVIDNSVNRSRPHWNIAAAMKLPRDERLLAEAGADLLELTGCLFDDTHIRPMRAPWTRCGRVEVVGAQSSAMRDRGKEPRKKKRHRGSEWRQKERHRGLERRGNCKIQLTS